MQNKQKWQTASLKRVKRRLIGRLGDESSRPVSGQSSCGSMTVMAGFLMEWP
jgi:hypothetical protein